SIIPTIRRSQHRNPLLDSRLSALERWLRAMPSMERLTRLFNLSWDTRTKRFEVSHEPRFGGNSAFWVPTWKPPRSKTSGADAVCSTLLNHVRLNPSGRDQSTIFYIASQFRIAQHDVFPFSAA